MTTAADARPSGADDNVTTRRIALDAMAKEKSRRASRQRWIGAASIVGGLLIWQLVGMFVVSNSLFLATPIEAIQRLVELAQDGTLWTDLAVSGIEFGVGYGVAAVSGIIIGMVLASYRSMNSIFGPWVYAFYATPIVALAPLLILWFGLGMTSKIVVVFSVAVFPVIISTQDGVNSTDRDLLEMTRALRATKFQTFAKVYLPSALPQIMTGLRLGIGKGLIGIVVADLFGATAGLGFLILNGADTFDMPQLFGGLFILALIGVILTSAFTAIERRVVHWQNQGDIL